MRCALFLLLFSLACNLDTVLLAAGFGLRGLSLTAAGAGVIAAVTTAITVASLYLGGGATLLFSARLSTLLGGGILLIMGLWLLLDRFFLPAVAKDAKAPGADRLLSWFPLAVALGVNNAGAGVAAGLSGLSPLWAGAVNVPVTLLCLLWGHALGRRARGSALERLLLPATAGLLLLLGVLALFR